MEVKNSSMAENAMVSLWTKGDNALLYVEGWRTGGKKIRLKMKTAVFILLLS